MRSVENLIVDLRDKDLREIALAELSRRREVDLGPLLWHSSGIQAILLQEIVSAYEFLSPPTLSLAQSHRVCNTLALFMLEVRDKDIRRHFIKADMPRYLYRFLETTCPSQEIALLRLYSLGVLGNLVKDSDPEAILFLLSSKLMPVFLKVMDMGTEMSKRGATFIVHKILLDAVGLEYVCTLAERFNAVNFALGNVLSSLAVNPSPRLFDHVIRCYLSFAQDGRSLWALSHLPKRLTDGTFDHYLEDPEARVLLSQLVDTIQGLLIAPGVTAMNDEYQSLISHYRPLNDEYQSLMIYH